MNRRGFLGAILAAAAAPAIARASSLMPVVAPKIIAPPLEPIIGSYDGFRFIEQDHVLDAFIYGAGIARIYRPNQRAVNRTLRESLEAMPLVRVERIEPMFCIVHPYVAADLRKAGIPVRRQR